MVLQVDVNGPAGKKFKFAPSGGGGADGVWSSNSVGVHTTKNVGVGTTARSNFALYVGGDQYVDGNITVGGTVTYEDVKNVDSIGIVTARTGIDVLAGGINVIGISTFQSHVHLGDDDELRFGANNDFKIVHDPNDCRFENSNGDIKFKNTGSYFFFDENGGETLASFINDGAVNLFHSGSKKLETTGTGATVFGTTETQKLNVTGVSTFQSGINAVGVVTSTKVHVGVDTGFFNEDLVVTGNARVTGILTIGTGSITLDPNSRKITGVDEIIIGTANTVRIHQGFSGEIIFSDREGRESSVGIGTTVSVNTTGIITATSFVGDLLKLTAGKIQSGIKTTTSTNAATIISLSTTTYRSVQYQIQVIQGTNYNMTTINAIHDGTDAYMTEFGTINQPIGIATFSTDINSGSLRLLGYPTSSNSTTFKVVYTVIDV